MGNGNKSTAGTLCVGLAYVAWGLLIIFWNLLSKVDSVYILSQRIIWSAVFMGIYILTVNQREEIKTVFRNKKDLLICFISGVLVTINWGVYIYAVNSSHVLDASMGYFMEPVMVAAIGITVFKEKPGVLERFTFAFSVAALVFIVIKMKTFPVLSILIAGSFAVYGAVKKNLNISAQTSLFTETLCMAVPALIYTFFAESNSNGAIGTLHGWEYALLPVCGVVTSLPLLLFNKGVKHIPYYISGILMYINPTLQFILGAFLYHEPLDKNRLTAFIIIWIGVAFTVAEKISVMVKTKKRQNT